MKSRGYCLTHNNYTAEDIERYKALKYQYLIIGREVGELGTPHLQMYVYWKNPISMKSMIKKAPGAHVTPATGNAAQNYEYCSKGGDFEEFGKMPKQGERVDLDEVKDEILAGKSVDDICLEDPMMYHQYGRTLNRIEDIALRRRFRTEMTKGIWYYGATGVGKSHKVFEDFDPLKCYVKNLRDEWWDGYTGQEVVILNEFRGQIAYSELLELIDKWPVSVKRRGREPVPFLAKEVRITSARHPANVYAGVTDREDSIDQLLRRVGVFLMNQNGTEVVGGNNRPRPVVNRPEDSMLDLEMEQKFMMKDFESYELNGITD